MKILVEAHAECTRHFYFSLRLETLVLSSSVDEQLNALRVLGIISETRNAKKVASSSRRAFNAFAEVSPTLAIVSATLRTHGFGFSDITN